MTVNFSENELKWIYKEPFNWRVKENCPDEIERALSKKLKTLKRFYRDQKETIT